jgi:hypothetical protein
MLYVIPYKVTDMWPGLMCYSTIVSPHLWSATAFLTLGGTTGMEIPNISGPAAIPEFTSASAASSKRVLKTTFAATATPTLNFN